MINKDLLKDESGVALVEYAFLTALIGVGLVAILMTLGTNVSDTYASVDGSMGGDEAEEAPAPAPEPTRTPIRVRDRR